MLSTGYMAQGVVTTQVERWLIIFSFAVGRSLFALYIAQLKTYLFALNRPAKDFDKKVCGLGSARNLWTFETIICIRVFLDIISFNTILEWY